MFLDKENEQKESTKHQLEKMCEEHVVEMKKNKDDISTAFERQLESIKEES